MSTNMHNADPRSDTVTATIVALLLAVSLGGCATPAQPTKQGATTEMPNPLQVSVQKMSHLLHYAPGAVIPSVAETASLNTFLAGNGVAPGDVVMVEHAPGLDEKRIQRLTTALARQKVAVNLASAPEIPGSDLRLTVDRYVASAPNCPNWSKEPGNDFGNTLHSDYGCATANNLAAMISDPHDLVEGRTMGPAKGNAAFAAMHRYNTGTVAALGDGSTNVSPELATATPSALPGATK